MASASRAADADVPVCFDMSGYASPAHEQEPGPSVPRGRHRLHGADDLITLFGLQPLWDHSVRPYMSASKEGISTDVVNANDSEARAVEGASKSTAADAGKPLAMDKTYGPYVQDLPGKVRPNRKVMNRYNAAAASATAAGAPPPPPPAELSGRTTMRDIVFRPETTVQRVVPFEEETLRAAFTVAAGNVPDIDLSLLESDGPDRASPGKRKKKRKHQREPDDAASPAARGDGSVAAKRSKLQALVSGGGRT